MTDQSDSSRFEPPPAEGNVPQPPAPEASAPVEPAASTPPVPPTQELPHTQPAAATPAAGWTDGTADNPYDENGAQPGGDQPADGGAGGGRNRLMMMGVGAAAAAAVVLGGGYVAYQQVLGGGGAQPESAIPANALAFAKIDLDPSGGQKIDALRFARKFPDAPADTKKDDADLRKLIFDEIQDDGGFEGVDYAKDVAPWLGQRFGFAVVPGESADEPEAILALAVTDVDKAKAGLAKLAESESNTHCSVGSDYAICGEDSAAVDAALKAGESSSLADTDNFADDFGSIGDDGIVSFWADLAKFKDLAAASEVGGADASAVSDQLQGRVFGALRFDGPTLELVGKGTGLADTGVSGDKNGVEALPADTMAAFGLSGGKGYAQKMWDSLEKSGLTSDVDSALGDSGLSLPGDLQTLLGDSFSVAFGGMDDDGMPKVALVTDSPEADVQALASKVEDLAGTPFSVKAADGRTVVALEDGYADAVASGKGLGDDAAFKDAVPDAGSAAYVIYANVGKIVEEFGADMPANDRKVADVFKSFGVSVGADGGDMDVRMRLTTN